ncbi:hypothetical protein A3C32_00105 [Candidatus Daviesbacteria bacterium RIFCSPHIGHO2_02_FULL_41_14]|nr:MAG: hypothetical protein A2780_00765 [Candidatus Daviesbacteria bacterium RIFCSPHIGHO2_01_FULL_41_45]OGE34083.1 MAG: hypothetical protein A3C32_00105 [Candidatus Daviesbacteria bacterium RIFCSPHIGHO2_02_FULL_41_14]
MIIELGEPIVARGGEANLSQDGSMLVWNKPVGVPVYGGSENKQPIGAREYISARYNDDWEPVNLIDRWASGALLFAKEQGLLTALTTQLYDQGVVRVYRALVVGQVDNVCGVIGQMGYCPIEKRAKLQQFPDATFTRSKILPLEYRSGPTRDTITLVEIETRPDLIGQVRLHLAHIGHPVCGSEGDPHRAEYERLMAHLYGFDIKHPGTGKVRYIRAPYPREFTLQ